jgi:hypothetical protein
VAVDGGTADAARGCDKERWLAPFAKVKLSVETDGRPGFQEGCFRKALHSNDLHADKQNTKRGVRDLSERLGE